jgi:hypothetical protein
VGEPVGDFLFFKSVLASLNLDPAEPLVLVVFGDYVESYNNLSI